MKKRNFLILSVIVLFSSVLIYFSMSNISKDVGSDVPQTDSLAELLEKELADSENGRVFASYGDSAESFDELEKEAECIVIAAVSSVTENGISQTAKLQVHSVLKGEVNSYITLYQMLNDDNVEVEKEYIIFMNKQEPAETEKDCYYPIAGGRGIMLFDEKNNTIEIDSQKLNSDSLSEWLTENIYSKNRTAEAYRIVVR